MFNIEIDGELFDFIAKYGKREEIPKGTVVYDFYDDPQYIYLLKQGVCSLISISETGKEQVYRYFKPGNLICLIPAYLNNIDELCATSGPYFSIETKSDCEMYKIYYKKFFELTMENRELNHFLIFNLIQACRNLTRHFHNSQKSNATSKLASTLLTLSEEREGRFIVDKEFNYVELSKYLGIHHVTIAKIIATFKEQNIISKKGHRIVIKDREALLGYVNQIEE